MKLIELARQGFEEQKTASELPSIEWSARQFAPLNLMADWPMKGPFDVVFCRNVTIDFNKPAQQWLGQRFYQLLGPGGFLLVGHSESLTASAHKFRYVQPTTYQK